MFQEQFPLSFARTFVFFSFLFLDHSFVRFVFNNLMVSFWSSNLATKYIVNSICLAAFSVYFVSFSLLSFFFSFWIQPENKNSDGNCYKTFARGSIFLRNMTLTNTVHVFFFFFFNTHVYNSVVTY